MNYPVWYIPSVGGSLLIAFIAIIHVVVSHFAVGGGLWLVLTEKKAYREKKKYIIEYVKKHTLFFMLITMVFGAITGVGIWFTIALIHPDATSVLIHSFVFGWATEWVLFLVEIVAAFLYFYTFEKISKKIHLLIGWIYFIAAWGSLVIINAILSFMLTPGKWISTGNFWDGILNPSFIPSTIFRTFLSFALAGSYALLTASIKFKGEERETLTKYNGKWILISLSGMIPSLIWYYFTLPVQSRSGISGTSYIMKLSARHLYISLGLFILLSLFFIIWKLGKLSFPISLITLLSLFIFFGAFEFIRESGRKPYIISNYMYSNGIRLKDSKFPKDFPVLSISKWTLNKSVDENNMKDAGREIFRIQCFACHSFGIKNNIIPKISGWSKEKIERIIGSLRGITKFMPDFHGDDMERKALAGWLYSISENGRDPQAQKMVNKKNGEIIFSNHCADCHETDGENPIRPKMEDFNSPTEIYKILGKLNKLNEDMPDFEGTDKERKTLSEYLFDLRSKK